MRGLSISQMMTLLTNGIWNIFIQALCTKVQKEKFVDKFNINKNRDYAERRMKKNTRDISFSDYTGGEEGTSKKFISSYADV